MSNLGALELENYTYCIFIFKFRPHKVGQKLPTLNAEMIQKILNIQIKLNYHSTSKI